jgi:hypothetical protein
MDTIQSHVRHYQIPTGTGTQSAAPDRLPAGMRAALKGKFPDTESALPCEPTRPPSRSSFGPPEIITERMRAAVRELLDEGTIPPSEDAEGLGAVVNWCAVNEQSDPLVHIVRLRDLKSLRITAPSYEQGMAAHVSVEAAFRHCPSLTHLSLTAAHRAVERGRQYEDEEAQAKLFATLQESDSLTSLELLGWLFDIRNYPLLREVIKTKPLTHLSFTCPLRLKLPCNALIANPHGQLESLHVWSRFPHAYKTLARLPSLRTLSMRPVIWDDVKPVMKYLASSKCRITEFSLVDPRVSWYGLIDPLPPFWSNLSALAALLTTSKTLTTLRIIGTRPLSASISNTRQHDGEALSSFCSALKTSTSLTHLDLSGTLIESNDCEQLTRAILANKSLVKVDLAGSSFDDDQIKKIEEHLNHLGRQRMELMPRVQGGVMALSLHVLHDGFPADVAGKLMEFAGPAGLQAMAGVTQVDKRSKEMADIQAFDAMWKNRSFDQCKRYFPSWARNTHPAQVHFFLLDAIQAIPASNWDWDQWTGHDPTLPARLCTFAARHGDKDAVRRLLDSGRVEGAKLTQAREAAREAGHADIVEMIDKHPSTPTPANTERPANLS